MNVHENKKPFLCTICPQGFARKNDLTRHGLTHSQEKKEYCDICHKGFTRRDVYLEHMRGVHSTEESQKRRKHVHRKEPVGRVRPEAPRVSRLLSPVSEINAQVAPVSTRYSRARSRSTDPVLGAQNGSLPLLNHVAEQLRQDIRNGRVEGSGYWGSFTSELHVARPTPSVSVTPVAKSTRASPDPSTLQAQSSFEPLKHQALRRQSSIDVARLEQGPAQGVPDLECGLCERCHVSSEELQIHLEEHIADFSNRPYSCEICNASFAWPAALATHKAVSMIQVRSQSVNAHTCADTCVFAHGLKICQELGHHCQLSFKTHWELGRHLKSQSGICSKRRKIYEKQLLHNLMDQHSSVLSCLTLGSCSESETFGTMNVERSP